MRITWATVCATSLLLAGCTSDDQTHPSPAPATLTATSEQVISPTVAPVAVPTRSAAEISRDVFTGTSDDGRIGDVPEGTHQLTLRIACAGSTGTRMRYTIENGKDSAYSSGDAPCDGRTYINTDDSNRFPSVALIHLDPDPGVTNGWATLTGS